MFNNEAPRGGFSNEILERPCPICALKSCALYKSAVLAAGARISPDKGIRTSIFRPRKYKRSLAYLLITIFYLLFLPGCVTSPYVKPVIPKSIALPGIYHKVVRGETLWKISKMYNISLDELTQVNRIGDNTAIEVGQQIFIPNYFRPQAPVVKYSDNDDFIWPIRGRIVGSFGQTINNMLNKGINITPYGSGDIVASRAGRVVFLNDNFAGLGKTIILDHGDGFFTVYSLSSEVFVRAGDNIKKGAVIAKLGSLNLGRNKYLHFEVRKGHIPQNPMFYLP